MLLLLRLQSSGPRMNWAKSRGLVVERGMEGFSTPVTHGKWSLRASATGELVFDNVKVPQNESFSGYQRIEGAAELSDKSPLWDCLGLCWCCHGLLRYRIAIQ